MFIFPGLWMGTYMPGDLYVQPRLIADEQSLRGELQLKQGLGWGQTDNTVLLLTVRAACFLPRVFVEQNLLR